MQPLESHIYIFFHKIPITVQYYQRIRDFIRESPSSVIIPKLAGCLIFILNYTIIGNIGTTLYTDLQIVVYLNKGNIKCLLLNYV